MDEDETGESGLSEELDAQTTAVFIMARGAVARATEQMFHGLNGLAPTPIPEIVLRMAIGQAYDCWIEGVSTSLTLVSEAAHYVNDGIDEGGK